MTNKEFSKTDYFTKCCNEAKVDATRRQASKYRREEGLAYKIGKINLKSKEDNLKNESKRKII
jgi:hypothetical protein